MDEETAEKIRAYLNRPERDAELMDGKAPAASLVGYGLATTGEDGVVLAVELLTGPPNLEPQLVRVLMSREECSKLAQALDRLARVSHVLPPEKLS